MAIDALKDRDLELDIPGAVKFVTAQTIAENNQNIDSIIANEELAATAKAEEIGTYILAADISAEITQIVINPINTIIRSLAESNMTLAASQDIIQTSFNLPDINLLNYDPLEAIRQGDERGLAVFTEQAKVQNTVVQFSNFWETQINDPEISVANIFIEQLANNLESLSSGHQVRSPDNPDAPTLLSNPAIVNNLIDNTVEAIPEDSLNSLPNNINSRESISLQESITQDETTNNLADTIQQNNQRIDEITANENLTLSEKAFQIAQIQQVAQNPNTSSVQTSTLNSTFLNEQIATTTVNNPIEKLDINNNVPVAEADTITLAARDPIIIDVLANDRDADGDNLSITEVYAIDSNNEITFKEEVTINEDGTVTYTPSDNFNGEDSFYYVATDGNGDFANAEVTIRQNDLNTNIYRFQNSSVPGTYLFVGEAERANIIENFTNFVEEGLAFKVGEQPGENLIPLYRFQNNVTPGTYLFAGETERASINENFSETFTEEGLAFYVYGADANLGETFYRFQNSGLPGTYLFAGETERANILENFPSFIEEGVAFEVNI